MTLKNWNVIRTILSCTFACALLLCTSVVAHADTEEDLETQLWQYVTDQNTEIALQTFLYSYPEGPFSPAAQLQLDRIRAKADVRTVETAIFELAGPVSFDKPMNFGGEALLGKSIMEVIDTSPAYPPVQGLPASYWENETCSNCHMWTRVTICTQAQNYVAMEPRLYQNKQHPFGGAFKMNLRNWAQNDCR